MADRIARIVGIEAASLNIATAEHANRIPWSGVLTRHSEPSTRAPHGTRGKRILLTREACERALPSLRSMAVNAAGDLAGHSKGTKIGVVETASISGRDVLVRGILWAADAAPMVKRIQANKDSLGLSFEALNIVLDGSINDEILTIKDLTWSGVAVLNRKDAAYELTSLAASADKFGRHVQANSALSAHRTWTKSVELFDRIGLTAPDGGATRYTVHELDRKIAALGLDPSTQIEVKTAAINCRLL